jgi:pimeloyl-ACP methyl ester carboxylesterase
MPYVSNQGVRIYYEVEGTGPPLVLAHGIGASLEDWREVGWVEPLRDRYQLILVDARGHGRSDKPHDLDAYRQIHQAMDHVAVLDGVGVEKAHFLGWSMGGIVCLGAGIHAPERCLSLMMGGTQPYARNERPPRTGLPAQKPLRGLPDVDNPIDQLLTRGGEAWAAFYEANMKVSASMRMRIMKNDFEALTARFAAMHEKRSLPHYLDPVQMPCLIYVGKDESAYGGAKQLADRLPDAKFVAFQGLNHFEMLTSVDVVLPEILDFLRKTG